MKKITGLKEEILLLAAVSGELSDTAEQQTYQSVTGLYVLHNISPSRFIFLRIHCFLTGIPLSPTV